MVPETLCQKTLALLNGQVDTPSTSLKVGGAESLNRTRPLGCVVAKITRGSLAYGSKRPFQETHKSQTCLSQPCDSSSTFGFFHVSRTSLWFRPDLTRQGGDGQLTTWTRGQRGREEGACDLPCLPTMSSTAAQDEFNDLISKNTYRETLHPEDRDDSDLRPQEDLSEEDHYRNTQIDAAMRMTTAPTQLQLPPVSFDSNHSTGVKGVINDARHYETARRNKWMNRVRAARRSVFGLDGAQNSSGSRSRSGSETDDDLHSSSPDNEEESFLQEWRESRRRELESEANKTIRTRRTSPSVRVYGRLDEVDAMGYLDAIEKVSRDTTVVVFVYDHACDVSETVETALLPIIKSNPTIHFVKIHYEDIEFDNAAVPALLAYRNQGDLFANLTGIIEMIPDEDSFGTTALKQILQKHKVL
ncbi:Phosducin-like protein [Paramyrothecium foliicola]|nr:Phosducin-like protein [Paramyrothecium foliicola]